ncbi:hypothetical protein [uncultured Ilyobacter sp.]|uniref:hypothetical protein n=1 Tax=uncultured Ilyobacter sp. TaxID=544433 RepID=UPI0029F53920|nr:hypothetical protein [uncultured Ilyobacter sp.]
MSYEVTKEYVWVGAIPDRPHELAEKLDALSDAGLNLELIVARREMPGRALLFVSPLRNLEEFEIAENVGLAIQEDIRAIRVTGPDAPGIGSRIAMAISKANLNIRGYTATALGDRMMVVVAFDNEADADDALAAVSKELGAA